MTDRLERTLSQFVETGQLTPELASEVSNEYHHRHVDIRQRLAELAGYAGAGLATVGLIVIGSQVWTDFSQVLRAALPAVASAALFVGTWLVIRPVGHISEHPARGRVAQVMGGVSAVLALLAIMLGFSPETGEPADWLLLVGSSTALLISLVVWHWVPGFINTLVTAVLALITGLSLFDVLGFGDGPAMALIVVGLGVAASLLLNKFFPPEWLTRAMGLMVWLQGTIVLMTAEAGFNAPDTPLRWTGRVSALALVLIGAWMFARGGDWLWAVASGLAAALLVGLWSLEAVNAGVALIIAGLVLIAAGLVLAGLRRAERAAMSESR
ncbi:MAG: DUF2157 domain-containing protein [Candidatus Nanopelagicales bacterium]|nr:DUF2157 domain-containing protein [Candidatus Nanopelagicales bacterium]